MRPCSRRQRAADSGAALAAPRFKRGGDGKGRVRKEQKGRGNAWERWRWSADEEVWAVGGRWRGGRGREAVATIETRIDATRRHRRRATRPRRVTRERQVITPSSQRAAQSRAAEGEGALAIADSVRERESEGMNGGRKRRAAVWRLGAGEGGRKVGTSGVGAGDAREMLVCASAQFVS